MTLSLNENGVIFRYIHLRLIFKMAASRFDDVSEEEINIMKENCYSEKHQICHKVRSDTFQRLAVKTVLNITKKPFKVFYVNMQK